MLITLSYLPTAERMCLTIVKAEHLKLPLSCGPTLPSQGFFRLSILGQFESSKKQLS